MVSSQSASLVQQPESSAWLQVLSVPQVSVVQALPSSQSPSVWQQPEVSWI
jgi:hypothetical protein